VTHWKAMMDPKEFLYAFDLQGRDVVVQIERVTAGEVIGDGGRKSKKPKCFFKGKSKPLILNATNCKTIAQITGTHDVEKWAGQWLTLYPTTTTSKTDGSTVDCIRIRPRAPRPPTGQVRNDVPEHEPGADGSEVQP